MVISHTGGKLGMKTAAKDYLMITVGMIVVVIAVYFFMIPLHIVLGSMSGLALVLTQFVPVSVSMMTLILNGVCLIAGFLLIGREFGVKTVYASLLQPFLLWVCEVIFPNQKSLTGDVLLDAIAMIIVVSAGQAIIFQAQASSGGLDIVAKIMNKYLHVELGKSIAVAGALIVLSAALVYDSKTVVLGLIVTYVNGLVVDEYIGGFQRKKKVCVISEKHDEIRKYINTHLGRGATLYMTRGSYEGTERTEVATIVTQTEYAKLMHFINETDPRAFVTVATVSEVSGFWNKKKGVPGEKNI